VLNQNLILTFSFPDCTIRVWANVALFKNLFGRTKYWRQPRALDIPNRSTTHCLICFDFKACKLFFSVGMPPRFSKFSQFYLNGLAFIFYRDVFIMTHNLLVKEYEWILKTSLYSSTFVGVGYSQEKANSLNWFMSKL